MRSGIRFKICLCLHLKFIFEYYCIFPYVGGILFTIILQKHYSCQCQKTGLEPVYEWLGGQNGPVSKRTKTKKTGSKGPSQKGPLFKINFILIYDVYINLVIVSNRFKTETTQQINI